MLGATTACVMGLVPERRAVPGRAKVEPGRWCGLGCGGSSACGTRMLPGR